MKLVFVHGRDQQKKNPKELQATWLATLKEGLGSKALPASVKVVFPYYGDELQAFVDRFDAPVGDEVSTRGGAIDPEYQAFRSRLIQEFQARAGVSDREVAAEYGGAVEKGPLNWRWVQAILRVLDRNLPAVGSLAIEEFTRDVYLYLKFDEVRDKLNGIVAAALAPGERTVVVGHSLGSVVAYDTLRKESRKLDVPLYLTVGSPLGVELIRTSLSPIRFPKPTVKSWLNAYDKRDVVALYPLDRSNFDVSPDDIEDYGKVSNRTDNRHGIVGYLNDSFVASRILSKLTEPGSGS
jgi:hypothetical protein